MLDEKRSFYWEEMMCYAFKERYYQIKTTKVGKIYDRTSISAVDLLKHVMGVCKSKSYSEIEVRKIVEETKRFNNQLAVEIYQFDQ